MLTSSARRATRNCSVDSLNVIEVLTRLRSNKYRRSRGRKDQVESTRLERKSRAGCRLLLAGDILAEVVEDILAEVVEDTLAEEAG